MEKRSGLEDIVWAFAIISGVVGVVELVSKPKNIQKAKLQQATVNAKLNNIGEGIKKINAKLGNQ